MLFASHLFAARVVDAVMSGQSAPDAMSFYGFERETPATRRFLLELVYGTLRRWGEASALVDLLANRPVKPKLLKSLLAVALYQLTGMRQPEFAVVDQAVRATAKVAPGAKGFVNAALRRFIREREALLEKARRSDEARYSYPGWWIRRVKQAYPENWQDILDAGNAEPPLTLRVNRRQVSRDAYLELLEKNGIAGARAGRDGIRLLATRDITLLPRYEDGWFSVQDASAQLAARLLDARDGQRVLDACAAPGGKTTHILESADVTLLALDNDGQRLERVAENAKRLQLDALPKARLALKVADASRPETWRENGERFDRILLDAPCSASGIVRRHPDIKWLRRDEDIPKLAKRQRELLETLWPCLEPGGKLLYVTCSVFSDENEGAVAPFAAKTPDCVRETVCFDDDMPSIGGQLLPACGQRCQNGDGLFYAVLSKTLS
jgi:16S rRNA (cytosine967-C5)-methyltransferase